MFEITETNKNAKGLFDPLAPDKVPDRDGNGMNSSIKKKQEPEYSDEVFIKTISPRQAVWILENYNYKYQRGIRRWHVRELAIEMENDRFEPSTVIIYACLPDGRKFLINGYHTLHAIIEYGQPVTVCVYKKFCKDDEQVSDAYYRCDRNIVRTVFDSIRSKNISEKLNLPGTFINKAGGALRTAKFKFATQNNEKRLTTPDAELVELLVDWQDEIRTYKEIIQPSGFRRKLFKQEVMGVGLLTLRFTESHDTAIQFWNYVAQQNHDDRKNPTRRLVEYLSNLTGNVSTTLPFRVMLEWNRFCKGQNLSRKDNFDRNNYYMLKTPVRSDNTLWVEEAFKLSYD